jgi:ABC-2 type transport system ATP-binding protein/lipopolysaccharide transport system ATP-binding protein
VDPAIAIRCDDVTKRFYYYEHRTATLRELFIRSVMRRPITVKAPLFTLRDFNLTVRQGESVALIGPNGSGKSTVLRLIAGIYGPTEGSVETRGRVTAVIELGAGFHDDLTGRENVGFYASVMGLTRKELGERFDDIVEFSGIGSFIDVPMKYYSSGMRARLAFAVSVCLDPDILLIDEVLAVGDEEFRAKCLNRLRELRSGGTTLVMVSHDMDNVIDLCSRAVWLEGGRSRSSGNTRQVADAYRSSAS